LLPKAKLLRVVGTPVVVTGEVLREGGVVAVRAEEIGNW